MNSNGTKKKICILVSSEMTIKAFLLDQIAALSNRYDVSVVLNTNDRYFFDTFGIRADVFPVRIERKISPWQDVKAFFYLFHLFKQKRFDVIHSVTPKAGLLAMLAGFWARVPVRIHTFTGQVWVTRSGIKRLVLKWMDKILAAFATNILIDSHSQRGFLIEQGVVSENKSCVLANGSISGVNTQRFHPNPIARAEIRSKFGISENDVIFLFLGRLNRDKGILDLAKAFSNLCNAHNNIYLLIVGPDEENLRPVTVDLCKPYSHKVHFIAFTNEPEKYMASADIFCLPSYREGFGSVIIEAASSAIPAIASRIYGITDAVEEDVTGLLYQVGNVDQLTNRMKKFIDDPALRGKMGENARIRAHLDFSKEKVTSATLEYYRAIMGKIYVQANI
jgi:glycosyltransferase involved in cell wall biosynthesis